LFDKTILSYVLFFALQLSKPYYSRLAYSCLFVKNATYNHSK